MNASLPKLRADLAIIEQVLRGEQSFVVKDPTTHAYFRFRPIEVRVMRLFDGLRSVAAITDTLVADGLRISAGTVDGFARKLSKLGLLEASLLERSTQQLERLRSERFRKRSLVRGELFRVRFSFGDPDRFLTRTYPAIRWCFSPAFVAVSLVLFVAYLLIMAVYAETYARELAATFSFSSLTPWSVLVFIGAFALLTAIHELGHAYACKHFGGEVHEMGFMLLFFMPAFYANVNDAWSFPKRSARLWVTAAGGWIELFLTALLAIAWLIVQPGSVISQVALASMLVGGVANLLANLNPLLPLDGYFALSDWLEVTNLRQRAKEYAGGWTRKHVLRQEVSLPDLDTRERRILLTYGICAAVYVTGFTLFLATTVVSAAYHALGVLVAGVLVLLMSLKFRRGSLTLWHSVRSAASNQLRSAWRALGQSGGNTSRWRVGVAALAVLLLAMTVIPVNMTASGRFTMHPITRSTVTSPMSGVVADVFVREGDDVVAGAPIVRLANYELSRESLSTRRVADSLQLAAQAAGALSRTGESDVLRAQAEGALAGADVVSAQLDAMRVRTHVAGRVISPYPERLIGTRVEFGQPLLHFADVTTLEAIVRVKGAGAASIRPGDSVRLLSYRNTAQPLTGVVQTVSPVLDDGVGAVEARVHVDAAAHQLAGATGEARITWRRTTLLGAVVWRLRALLRADLLI